VRAEVSRFRIDGLVFLFDAESKRGFAHETTLLSRGSGLAEAGAARNGEIG
jgi:hypothetical protein